jgi:hypothetical protein
VNKELIVPIIVALIRHALTYFGGQESIGESDIITLAANIAAAGAVLWSIIEKVLSWRKSAKKS